MRRRRLVLCCAALAALSAGRPVAVPAADADGAYAALAQRYFDESFRAQPVFATQTGVHTFDRDLGSYAPADWAAQLRRDHRYLDDLAAIDPATLSARGRLDRTMLENALRDDLLLNETMQSWRHKPDQYVQTAATGIFSLISREFAPPATRLAAVVAREEAIPRLYAQARASLTSSDAVSAQLAVDDAAGTASFFEKDVPAALAGAGDATLRRRFRASTRAAAAATRAFATFVRTHFVAHPTGTYAIGAANYAARLKVEEALDLPLDAYLAVGMRALATTHRQMVETAQRIDPHATVEAVVARVSHEHPTAAGLIPASQRDLVALRRFIVAHHIIDLPPDATISVTLTPAFERQTTVASMDPPGPLERVATKAYYNVTPVDPRDPRPVQEAYLETFNDFERPIVSAHEVYPGHFTNFAIDRHLPLSLTEKMLSGNSFVEGWAHYGEQMMVDEGWGGGDPRVRLMQLKEAILRNARYVVGVGLHTQGWSLERAQRFFRTEAFLDAADARIESRRGTQDATYGYYTLGKLEILKLRDDVKKKQGAAFSLARFHHDLLQYGDPPVPLIRALILGDADDGKILPG